MSPRRTNNRACTPDLRRGAALVVAMICTLLVSLISAALVRTTLLQLEQLQHDEWQLQAEWLAESALDLATSRLGDVNYHGETWLPHTVDGAQLLGRVEIKVG